MRINLIIKIFYLISILIVTGCETKPILFTGPYHVRFSIESETHRESELTPIPIEVHIVGPANQEDVTINYAMSGSAREGIDYTIENVRGEITIPAGEFFGYIELQLINNANNILRSQDIVFTLESTTGDLAIGQGESEMGKSFTFTILDDCILGGIYTAEQGSTTLEGVSITSSDCEEFTLSNWNIGVFDTDVEMDLTFRENDDYSLIIPTQEEQQLNPEFATIRGTGFSNPSTGSITFRITLVDIKDDNEQPIEIEVNLQL